MSGFHFQAEISRVKNIISFLVLVSGFFAGCLSSAQATMEFTTTDFVDAKYLIVSGTFEYGDDGAAFRRALDDHRPDAITFDSTGGNIAAAMNYGREIRRRGLKTLQNRRTECASACVFAFMGGSIRMAQPGSLGVHQMTTPSDLDIDAATQVSEVQIMVGRILSYLSEMGVSSEFLQISSQIEPEDMRYLTGKEMTDLRVISTTEDLPVQTARVAREVTEIKPQKDRVSRKTEKKPSSGQTTPSPSSETSELPPLDAPVTIEDTTSWRFGTKAEDAPVSTEERSILYLEDVDPGRSGTAAQGAVTWSLGQETDLNGDVQAILGAVVEIPERDVEFDVRIKPNDDINLPASHLVEIRYILPENFASGDILEIPGLVMKPTEEARGVALIGSTVKVSPGYFWIALSDVPDELQHNLNFLRERGWIDIPIVYENRRRGILTLEKGEAGTEAVEKAVAAWQFN